MTPASVTEGSNEVAAGNVLVNDTDVDATQTVSVAGFAAGTPGSPPTGNAGATVSGTYGDLTLNADGSYSYVLGVTGAQQSAIETLGSGSASDVFTYTAQDDFGALNNQDYRHPHHQRAGNQPRAGDGDRQLQRRGERPGARG